MNKSLLVFDSITLYVPPPAPHLYQAGLVSSLTMEYYSNEASETRLGPGGHALRFEYYRE